VNVSPHLIGLNWKHSGSVTRFELSPQLNRSQRMPATQLSFLEQSNFNLPLYSNCEVAYNLVGAGGCKYLGRAHWSNMRILYLGNNIKI